MTAPATPASEPDAPGYVQALIQEAEAARASDIHLQRTGQEAQVAFRLDGLLTPPRSIPQPLAERAFGRIKFLARLKTYQESLPQDGRIDKADVGATHDLRVATYPTVTGEKIVLRLFGQASTPQLHELGLAPAIRGELERFLSGPAGLLLLTGPAGSGKTTTIYACLQCLAAQGGRHIITIEDPVEQILPGIMQTEVNDAQGLDFARAARHLLRQDPQVLVIGEIRDDATAQLALQAALTGHQVISTLHAGSCRGVFDRLLLMCPDRFVVFAAIQLVLNQRLARRLCSSCQGAGCPTCLHTGYRGRIPIVEWLRLDDALRLRARTQGLDALAPTHTLAADAQRLADARVTDRRELGRILPE
jgi:type II secretory ATPase GspE/PulE/Tfp pilus assembly ATPase PilB-like protein